MQCLASEDTLKATIPRPLWGIWQPAQTSQLRAEACRALRQALGGTGERGAEGRAHQATPCWPSRGPMRVLNSLDSATCTSGGACSHPISSVSSGKNSCGHRGTHVIVPLFPEACALKLTLPFATLRCWQVMNLQADEGACAVPTPTALIAQ